MATESMKPATIAVWVIGLLVIAGIVVWMAGYGGGPAQNQQTGGQTQTAPEATQPAQEGTGTGTGGTTTTQ